MRPMGYLALFNEAFDLYKRNFVLLTGVSLVAYVPYFLLTLLARDGSDAETVVLLGSIFMATVAYGATARAVYDRYLDAPVSIAGAWGPIRRRLLPCLLTGAIAWAVFVIGWPAFIYPAVAIYIHGFFLWHVMTIEGKHWFGAYLRSRELTSGQMGRLFVVSLINTLIVAAAPIALMGLAFWSDPSLFSDATTSAQASSSDASIASEFMAAIFMALLFGLPAPLATTISTLLYIDIRIRKEGLDVELLAEQLAAHSPPEPAQPQRVTENFGRHREGEGEREHDQDLVPNEGA
jgi:hypothetical protein